MGTLTEHMAVLGEESRAIPEVCADEVQRDLPLDPGIVHPVLKLRQHRTELGPEVLKLRL